MNKRYRLKKDLPDSKFGDLYIYLPQHDAYFKNGNENESWWKPSYVENNIDWFEEFPKSPKNPLREWSVLSILIESGKILHCGVPYEDSAFFIEAYRLNNRLPTKAVIQSVRRGDNETFKIGDITRYGVISKFYIDGVNDMCITFEGGSGQKLAIAEKLPGYTSGCLVKKPEPPKKEYEILSFIGTMEYNSELLTLDHDGLYRVTYTAMMGRYGVTLENMMVSVIGGRHAIRSVRILSDNRILTLGDNTDFGVIAAFSFNEIDDLVVNTTKGNIICARMVYKVGECKNSFYGKPVPPIGLIPEFIHKTARLNEIQGAIDRYNSAFKEVPQDWVNEKRYIDDWLTNYHLRKIKKQ